MAAIDVRPSVSSPHRAGVHAMSTVAHPAKQPSPIHWLKNDTRKPPEAFARPSPVDLGTDELPVDRYISRSFHEQEMAKMWPRAWQMACHVSEIPEVGSY